MRSRPSRFPFLAFLVTLTAAAPLGCGSSDSSRPGDVSSEVRPEADAAPQDLVTPMPDADDASAPSDAPGQPDAVPQPDLGPDVCAPSCEGRQCGSDGCGGSCGDCGPFGTCTAGLCAFCAGWTETLPRAKDQEVRDVAVGADGLFVLVGVSDATETLSDAWVAAVNPGGEVVWERTFGGARWDEAYAVDAVPGGGYVVAGYRAVGESDASERFWVARLGADGAPIWETILDSDTLGWVEHRAHDVRATSDGGFIAVGRVTVAHSYDWGTVIGPDAFVVKLDAEGRPEWRHFFGGDPSEAAEAVVEVAPGRFAVVGWAERDDECATDHAYIVRCADAWVAFADAAGIAEPIRFPATNTRTATTVARLADGRLVVGGSCDDVDTTFASWTAALDAEGGVLDDTFLPARPGRVTDLTALADGGFLVAAWLDEKPWLARHDAVGAQLWGAAPDERDVVPEALVPAASGFVGAGTLYGDDDRDPWVVRLDGDGRAECP